MKQSVTETVQTAESKQLQETLEKIQTQATEISDNLNDYSWIGSEEDGKISYLKQLDDGSWQVRKIQMCIRDRSTSAGNSRLW